MEKLNEDNSTNMDSEKRAPYSSSVFHLLNLLRMGD